jgi:hypothetical protein
MLKKAEIQNSRSRISFLLHFQRKKQKRYLDLRFRVHGIDQGSDSLGISRFLVLFNSTETVLDLSSRDQDTKDLRDLKPIETEAGVY